MKRNIAILLSTAVLGAWGGYLISQTRGEPVDVVTIEEEAEKKINNQEKPNNNSVNEVPNNQESKEIHTINSFDNLARTESELNTASVVKNASSGLVYIETMGENTWFGVPSSEGFGSGFFVTDQGDIITNYHVIEGTSKVNIRVHNDPKVYEAKIIGTAPDYDLALIRSDNLPKNEIKPLKLGNDKNLEVGLKAIALGAPFGLDFSVSEGIISSLDRKAPVGVSNVTQSVIQTDAAINPGNSGGPLLNSTGEVIGVNTQILTGGISQSAGVGFAIPVSVVSSLLERLQKGEKIFTPKIGISMFDLSSARPEVLARYELPEKGILITNVYANSPAEKAGLRAAKIVITENGQVPSKDSDIIIKIEGKPVSGAEDLRSVLITKQKGDSLKITIKRGEEILEKEIILTGFNFNE